MNYPPLNIGGRDYKVTNYVRMTNLRLNPTAIFEITYAESIKGAFVHVKIDRTHLRLGPKLWHTHFHGMSTIVSFKYDGDYRLFCQEVGVCHEALADCIQENRNDIPDEKEVARIARRATEAPTLTLVS